MGRQVAGTYPQSRHQLTVSTVAAASIAGSSAEVRLWVGDNVLSRKTEWFNAGVRLAKAFAENGAVIPTGVGTNYGTYRIQSLNSAAVTVDTSAAVPTVTENEIVLIFGRTFPPSGQRDGCSQLVEAFVRRALGRLLEDRKAA